MTDISGMLDADSASSAIGAAADAHGFAGMTGDQIRSRTGFQRNADFVADDFPAADDVEGHAVDGHDADNLQPVHVQLGIRHLGHDFLLAVETREAALADALIVKTGASLTQTPV